MVLEEFLGGGSSRIEDLQEKQLIGFRVSRAVAACDLTVFWVLEGAWGREVAGGGMEGPRDRSGRLGIVQRMSCILGVLSGCGASGFGARRGGAGGGCGCISRCRWKCAFVVAMLLALAVRCVALGLRGLPSPGLQHGCDRVMTS